MLNMLNNVKCVTDLLLSQCFEKPILRKEVSWEIFRVHLRIFHSAKVAGWAEITARIWVTSWRNHRHWFFVESVVKLQFEKKRAGVWGEGKKKNTHYILKALKRLRYSLKIAQQVFLIWNDYYKVSLVSSMCAYNCQLMLFVSFKKYIYF